MRYISILLLTVLLTACGRSKEPMLYVLNPLSPHPANSSQLVNLRIGIDDVTVPDYLDKSQLSVYSSPHQSKLYDNYQWAESVDSNVKRVIRANLSNLLPHAAVTIAPFNFQFKPELQIVIHINQFRVDLQGNSVLQADFEIYEPGQNRKKYTVSYFQKIKEVNPVTIVSSMNNNLNRLSQDLAYRILRHSRELSS